MQRFLGFHTMHSSTLFVSMKQPSEFLPDVDLCHEHNGLFCLGGAMACAKSKKPYILTFSADPIYERELVGQTSSRNSCPGCQSRNSFMLFGLLKKIICVFRKAKQQHIRNWQWTQKNCGYAKWCRYSIYLGYP